MFEEDRWYPRLADMPGVVFAGSPGVQRSKLRGSNTRPRKSQWGLEWPEQNGEWSSPAQNHRKEFAELTTAQLAKNVWECLELPGTLSDWHFTLQDAVGELFRRRHIEPAALFLCEQFALIDLQLTHARPQAFLIDGERSNTGTYVSVTGMNTLVRIYRASDDLPQAIEIARHAESWGNVSLSKAADEMQALLDAGL